jgi:hypothetical protein
MSNRDLKKIEAAREAAAELSWHYTSPRTLEADLDILASALRKLPRKLTGIPKDADEVFGLCDILGQLHEARLVSADALSSCSDLEELTDVADYDMGDPEDFATEAENHINDLKAELEKLLETLEAKIS